ncbi:hypothetical protein D9M68_898700 [compost metagenome]
MKSFEAFGLLVPFVISPTPGYIQPSHGFRFLQSPSFMPFSALSRNFAELISPMNGCD